MNRLKNFAILVVLGAAASSAALAQFTGPSATGKAATVAESRTLPPGRYIQVVGHVVEHLRGDYYTFRDASGEIRVEIESEVWRGRPIGPETRVRLLAEVDQGATGRYLWVKSLAVVE